MEPKLFNRVFRFDLLQTYTLENTKNLFFKYSPNTPKKENFIGHVMIEKDIDNGTLWINERLMDSIQSYYTTAGETPSCENLQYVTTDLQIIFNTQIDFLLPNKIDNWNPNKLNWGGFEIRIATTQKEQFWNEILNNLVFCSQ